MFNEGEWEQRVSEGPGPRSFDDSVTKSHRYIIIKYLHKTCTLWFFFSPSHNRVWMMNVRCKSRHHRRRTKCARCTWCQSVRFKWKPVRSPMLGCFSKRQILASLSSFWWSAETQTRVNTGYFFFYACQHPQEWLASWVIRHEVSCRSALTSRRTSLTAPVWCSWQSHFGTCVLCALAGSLSGRLFSLSPTKWCAKIMWPDMCLVGCHKLSATPGSSRSGCILTSRAAVTRTVCSQVQCWSVKSKTHTHTCKFLTKKYSLDIMMSTV